MIQRHRKRWPRFFSGPKAIETQVPAGQFDGGTWAEAAVAADFSRRALNCPTPILELAENAWNKASGATNTELA